jgi:hypothetical protein
MTNNWLYQGQEFTEPSTEYVGFIYRLVSKETGRKYIGKKNFWGTKISQKKNKKTGKVKKTRTKVPSDWQDYYSSNDEIKAEAAAGKPFEREILRLCKSKAEMTYWETKLQFQYDVLLDESYYNGWIMCRVRRAHLMKMER